MQKGLLLTFGILIFGLQWVVGMDECGVLEEIEAVDDFLETYRGIILDVNVLENDKGDNIKLVEIIDYPRGIILNQEENGWIRYVLNPSTPLNSKDSLEYVIEDVEGQRDTAEVAMFFLEVGVSVGNHPPYEVTYVTEDYLISKTLLEGEKFFEPVCISEWEKYEVYISDSEGNEFYYTSEFWCSHLPYCYRSWQPYQIKCNGNGTTTVQFDENGGVEEAFWTAPDGHRQILQDGDVVLDKSYLQFFQMCGGQSDTLVNCFSASDDYLVVGVGRQRGFNVLENDFGENIEVSKILKMPVCGELESWNSGGYLQYSLGANADCEMDSLTYILTNEFGQKDTATIGIEIEQEPTLILNWEVECYTEALGLLSVTIENGVPPYSVFGLFNDEIVDNHFSLLIPQNVNGFIEVVDAFDSKSAKFEPTYWGDCAGDCYELADKTYWGAYTIECNEDGTANIEGAIVNNADDFPTRKSFWMESDGTYHPLDFAEIGNIDFPNHSYFYVETRQSGHIDGFVNCSTTDIEAIDDFATTIPGEPVSINVLANDQGDGLRLTQILEIPQCGEILEWSEFGEVVYVADADTECTVDNFVYEVEDSWGNKGIGIVTILIIETTPKLEVQYDWSPCETQWGTSFYSVNLLVNGNRPPFRVDVNGIKDTLFTPDFLSYQIEADQLFEIYVIDSIGQEYYAIGGETNCWGYIPCDNEPNEKPIFNCIGGGKVSVETSEELLQDAYWVDLSGVSRPLKQIDTVPNLSYLLIPQLGNYDTLLNCLSANDDYFEVPVEVPYSFGVLGNDFGQKIQVSNILQMPSCGELLEWSEDGSMVYQMNSDENCTIDSIVYELQNDLGETTIAKVELDIFFQKSMYLTWDIFCNESELEIEIYVEIHGGTPPYTVSGTLNDIIIDSQFTLPLSYGEIAYFGVMDDDGQMDSLEIDTNIECIGYYNNCYEPEYIDQYLEVECIGEMGVIINYLLRMNFATIENAFYIDSQNQYHKLSNQDTIPNHSYYYLELKHLGHIDGYINCLSTSIEDKNETISNSLLQLYPNPNQGQFSLQIKTSKPPLQSYPIQIYNTAGQSIWKGTLQSNRLEALDLGNVGSGLYVLQVVMEEEVLVERFWVE